MSRKYSQLEELMGGYFHQDWDIEGNNDSEVISVYVKAITIEKLDATIFEIEKFLKDFCSDEGAIEEYLRNMGCEYYYQAENLTGEEWLCRVRTLLLSGRRSHPRDEVRIPF